MNIFGTQWEKDLNKLKSEGRIKACRRATMAEAAYIKEKEAVVIYIEGYKQILSINGVKEFIANTKELS